MKKSALTLAERQPVAVRAAAVAAVTAVVHVLVVLGVVDVDTEKAIASAVDALGGLALVIWTIRAVTPNAKVITRVTTDGQVVAGDASTLVTGQVLAVHDDTARSGEMTVVSRVPVNPELVA